MNNITGSLYRVNGKNHEKKCSQVKSVLSQRQFKTPCLQAAREDRSDGVSLTAGGRLFQARTAATENARSPSAKRLQWRHQDFHPGRGHDKHVHKSRHTSQECIHEEI